MLDDFYIARLSNDMKIAGQKNRDPVPRTPRFNYARRMIRAQVAPRNKKYLKYLKYHRSSSSEYLEVFPEGQRLDFYIIKLHFFFSFE